jgi:hypothetical protein
VSHVRGAANWARLAAVVVCAAAILPYVSTIDDYFIRDDFGVVQLLSQKPATYFPRWFATSWMDDIWGFVPDEVRPFPALSYQLTSLGGSGSPVLHHVLNILIHAINGLLVIAIARTVASVVPVAATFAALVFVLLPVHTESVAWITGRVDTMPAFFYLASFVAYVRHREGGGRSAYLASLALFFVALFTKQNTITMVGTLVAYDVLVRRVPIRPLLTFARPYVPFLLMTGGYLWLRYLLFGQAAREDALNARALEDFSIIADRHLKHVILGGVHGSREGLWATFVVILGICVAVWRMTGNKAEGQPPAGRLGALLYFGPVWWAIGIAPVAVAGYESPRHVYIAAVGWAIVLGILFDMLWAARASIRWRRSVMSAAAIVLALYMFPLARSIRDWHEMAAVSQHAVRDVRRAALASPEGTLLVIGAPISSWAWALPFSVRPPFVRTDLRDRVFIVSPRALSCCGAQWPDETRETIKRWSNGRMPESVVFLRWDENTGALARATSTENPQLPVLVRALTHVTNVEDLDANIWRMLQELTVVVEQPAVR